VPAAAAPFHHSVTPSFQCSIIPSFQCSTIPSFHHSIIPVFEVLLTEAENQKSKIKNRLA
jgi:hypothetical protein